jgi:tRNA-2-methylthio-N6-dimethylallyladenosine synthase
VARIYIETHGCQMNEADSQYLARRAAAAGYEVAERPEDAAVLVLNTCTVRDNAETRAYGRMNQWKTLKARDPRVKVVVAGCLAEQDRDRMRSLAPHLDGVFGTKELKRLGDQLDAWRASFEPDDDTGDPPAFEFEKPLGGDGAGVPGPYAAVRAFVNVQRGCSYYCTFCIVPQVRGRFDHRPMEEILAEVRQKADGGAREIMLVGQTVNAYREPATGADFADLLHEVAAIPSVERIGFISSHPKDLNEKLALACAAIPKMNPRLHLALQSGSNPVLRRMNRKYTIEQFLERVATFRSHNPQWAITTDLIVGFPGETEADFQRTLEVCATGLFAQAYMFVYSPRRGTPAAHWEQIPAEVARDRFMRLVAVQDPAVSAYHARKIGTVVRALIQGPSRKDPLRYSAKSIDNVTVNAPLVEPEPNLAEPWIDVRIERAHVWGVSGTLIARVPHHDAPARPIPAEPRTIDLLAAVR